MIIETIALLVVIGFLLYKWESKKANYFVGRNVKYDKYKPLIIMIKDIALRKKSVNEIIVDLYRKFDGEK